MDFPTEWLLNDRREAATFPNPPWRLSHKPEFDDLKSSIINDASASTSAEEHESRRTTAQERRRISRSSLHKPLPELPRGAREVPRRHHASIDSSIGNERKYLVRDARQPIDVRAHIDMSNTEETHMDVSWSPAVTKEMQIVNSHELVHEAITREIHDHHYHHRILPVIDLEVLPPRHFVLAEGGGYTEISEAEIPGGGNTEELQQIVKDAVTSLLPKQTEDATNPRQFTARTFEDTEGDFEDHTTPEGVRRTERRWVYPPSPEEGGRETGQTQPMYFGSSLWADVIRDQLARKSPGRYNEPSTASVEPRSSEQRTSIRTVLPIRMVHGDR